MWKDLRMSRDIDGSDLLKTFNLYNPIFLSFHLGSYRLHLSGLLSFYFHDKRLVWKCGFVLEWMQYYNQDSYLYF